MALVQLPYAARRSLARPVPPTDKTKSSSTVTALLVIIAISWLIALPKGGVKFGGMPITWAYLALLLVALWSGARNLFRPNVLASGLIVGFPVWGFSIWMGLIILMNGFVSISLAAGSVVAFALMPLVILVFARPALAEVRPFLIFTTIKYSIRFVVIYGIIIYAFKIFTGGAYFEIPYITVNAADAGELANKFNNRGFIDKFFSTYNNGNIYGACMCMLMPVYISLEKNRTLLVLFLLTIVMTISRTAYLGLVVGILLYSWARGISPQRIFAICGALLALAATISGAMFLLGFSFDWLTDAQLGGRKAIVQALPATTVFPYLPWGRWFEMSYVSALTTSGLIGLVLFCVHLWWPIFWSMSSNPKNRLNARYLKAGLITYCVMSIFDGAALFPPVLALYWLLATLVSLYSFPIERA